MQPTSTLILLQVWTALFATGGFLLMYLNNREIRKMSVTAAQAQQDLDNLTAGVLQLLPDVALTLNNQSTLIAQLRQQLAAAGQQPNTTIDPDKVEADVQSIQNQLAALGTANQNAKAGDTPPPAPGASGSSAAPAPASAGSADASAGQTAGSADTSGQTASG